MLISAVDGSNLDKSDSAIADEKLPCTSHSNDPLCCLPEDPQPGNMVMRGG